METIFQPKKQAVRSDEIVAAGNAFWTYALEVARSRAGRLGMSAEAALDCATGFLIHLLVRICLSDPPDLTPPVSRAWVRRCAYNWAHNESRRQRCLARREVGWAEFAEDKGARTAWDIAATAPSPESCVIERELHARILRAAVQLPPAQHDLFDRYFLQEESVHDLAVSSQRTPVAIRLHCLKSNLMGSAERPIGRASDDDDSSCTSPASRQLQLPRAKQMNNEFI